MKSVLNIFALCVLFTLVVQCFANDPNCNSIADNNTVLIRPKRYLDFVKGSRMFFRANIKENVFTWGALWAHAQGWKANIPFLNSNKAIRPVYFRRDTYEVLRHLLDLNGLNGQVCMIKAFCIASRTPDGEMANGMLYKLVRHVFK